MVYKMTPQKIMINLIEIPVLDAFSPSINIIIISQTSTAAVGGGDKPVRSLKIAKYLGC